MLGRELTLTPQDRALLCFERMRLIDMANRWAPSTLQTYDGHFRHLRNFEQQYGVAPLRPPPLSAPPTSSAIGLGWLQQKFSLRVSARNRTNSSPLPLAYNTIRGFRKAITQYGEWALAVSLPERALQDASQSFYLADSVWPSCGLNHSLMSTGMKTRLGDKPNSPVALQARQVRWMDEFFHSKYTAATTAHDRQRWALAGTTNLLAWTSWVRSRELFDLRVGDVTLVYPADGPTLGLPPLQGAVLLTLLAATKTNRSRQADVVVAFVTASGLRVGIWVHRLRREMSPTTLPSHFLLQDSSGLHWSSSYFRTTFLYPLLALMRLEGDPYLRAYNGIHPNTFENKFWNWGIYRRGGESHVSKRRWGCLRKATDAECYEHARWEIKAGSEKMHIHYREWPIDDRLQLTVCCM